MNPLVCFCFALVACLFALTPVGAATESEPQEVVVVDGDTIDIDGKTVSLYGIDAPELGQHCKNGSKSYRCGYEAAIHLKKLVGNQAVTCDATPADSEDNSKICTVGSVDLSQAMLQNGYATAKLSAMSLYKNTESEAKRSGLGIWRGDFVQPSEWRAGRRLNAGDGQIVETCDVKGIVSDNGDKVYFVPTDIEYGDIEIDSGRGEEFFCSDDQAELAGWRRWPKSAVRNRTASPPAD